MGLGPVEDVSLKMARKMARDSRQLVRAGKDPISERRLAMRSDIPTFEEAADRYAKAHAAKWTNEHHRKVWRRQIEIHAEPKIGNFPVDEIEIHDVLRVLEPIWNDLNETASRVRGRIEKILDWATVQKFRSGRNPARWRGNLDALLPSPNDVQDVEHYRALAWSEVPAFMVMLRAREGIGARALEFTILTASRSGEVRGATWDEIDLEDKLWTVPATRMKAGREHRVPLSDQAMELLKKLQQFESTSMVFPSPRKGTMISDMTMTKVLRDMEVDAVPHGFRSSFRDWCAESTAYANEVAEMALAHAIPSAVEAAYRRGDLFEKRRKMMNDWGEFTDRGTADSIEKGRVVPIRESN
jgi:integrase